MSLTFLNHNRINPIRQAPKGKCRGCLGPVPKGRLKWCSQQCVTDALIRKGHVGTIRQALKERDKQICQRCGMNTIYVGRILRALDKKYRNYKLSMADRLTYRDACRSLYRALYGCDGGAYTHRWEADHIVPVSEGGGNRGLQNYRTLCRLCHRQETKLLAGRRAAARRAAKEQQLTN